MNFNLAAAVLIQFMVVGYFVCTEWVVAVLSKFFQTVTSVDGNTAVLKRRAYGAIEVVDQQLIGIHLRPYPKMVSITEAIWADVRKKWFSSKFGLDRIMLYYDQPVLYPKFLALKYFVSDDRATLATIAVSLSVLDYIAKIKDVDAIVTEVTNKKIQDRHLRHFGWEPHMTDNRRRNWIKRFYGQYPDNFLFQEMAECSNHRETELAAQN